MAPAAARQQRRIASFSDAEIHVATELRRREHAASPLGTVHSHIEGLVAVPVSGAFRTEIWAPSKRRREATNPKSREQAEDDFRRKLLRELQGLIEASDLPVLPVLRQMADPRAALDALGRG